MNRLSSLVVSILLGVPFIGCEPTGVIEDLGTLGGNSAMGLGINEAGNVSGAAYLSGADPHSAGMHAFRYVDGLGMLDVGALPTGNISEGQGINRGGIICGGSFVDLDGDSTPHAFYATATLTLIDIGTLGGEYSYAWDINDQGRITGEASITSGATHAFLWTSESGMQDLGTLSGTTSVGRSINNSGQIAGESQTRGGGTRAFRFTEGAGMVDLGTLGGVSSAYGINDSGQVVGDSDTGFVVVNEATFRLMRLFGTHAFLWTEGTGMEDLGHLGGGESRAYALNNVGVVVGKSKLANGADHAFRWTRREGMIDLNTLLPSASGWVLTTGRDINDEGQITGDGEYAGAQHAFRLNPQPPLTKLP